MRVWSRTSPRKKRILANCSGGKASRSSCCCSYCFSSSREKTMTFLGLCSDRTRWTKRRPNEPVPPVISTTLPSSTPVLGAKERRAAEEAAGKDVGLMDGANHPRPAPILAQAGGLAYQARL